MISIQKMTFQNQQPIKNIKKQVPKTRQRKQKNSNPPIFITKTYQILQNNVYNHIINWNEEGLFFIISDVQRFQQQVLPIHFRHRNFSSFVRQLNMYDFHKIRNDNNINIFEHKQFKRDYKQCLRNIKRKACSNKKIKQNQYYQQNISISQQEELQYQNQETPKNNERNYCNQDKYQKTIESIGKDSQQNIMDSLRFIRAQASPNIQKRRKMQQFINNLPEILETQQQIEKKINQLKRNPEYECLNSKKDIRKIISRIRRRLPKRQSDGDLQQLSIQEQILAQKIDFDNRDFNLNPSLAILSTEKFLPKSINLIGSMNFCDQAEHLFFHKLY